MTCSATTRKGLPCRGRATKDGLCNAHRGIAGGADKGRLGGRPAKIKATEALRLRVEADIDRWLQPFEDALQAVIVVKYEGAAFVTGIPDVTTRMAAAEKVLDRVYGRPRQMTELTGADGGPLTIAQLAQLAVEAPTEEA